MLIRSLKKEKKSWQEVKYMDSENIVANQDTQLLSIIQKKIIQITKCCFIVFYEKIYVFL